MPAAMPELDPNRPDLLSSKIWPSNASVSWPCHCNLMLRHNWLISSADRVPASSPVGGCGDSDGMNRERAVVELPEPAETSASAYRVLLIRAAGIGAGGRHSHQHQWRVGSAHPQQRITQYNSAATNLPARLHRPPPPCQLRSQCAAHNRLTERDDIASFSGPTQLTYFNCCGEATSCPNLPFLLCNHIPSNLHPLPPSIPSLPLPATLGCAASAADDTYLPRPAEQKPGASPAHH